MWLSLLTFKIEWKKAPCSILIFFFPYNFFPKILIWHFFKFSKHYVFCMLLRYCTYLVFSKGSWTVALRLFIILFGFLPTFTFDVVCFKQAFWPGVSSDRVSTVRPEMDLYTFSVLLIVKKSPNVVFSIYFLVYYFRKTPLFWYLTRYLAWNRGIEFSKLFIKNATKCAKKFLLDDWNSLEIYLKLNNRFELLVKNETVWYTAWLTEF